MQVNISNIHPSIKVHVFQSVRSPDFVDYLKSSGIYFLMCHDGANAIRTSEDPLIQSKTNAEKHEIETQESRRRVAFRALICELVRQGYNVALINGLEWLDTKVYSAPCFFPHRIARNNDQQCKI